MLDGLAKVVAILGTVSAAVLGWLLYTTDTRGDSWERIAAALEEAIAAPDGLTQSPETARAALEKLGTAAETVDAAARSKGYTDLPPVRITQDPVWVTRNSSANWDVPGVGQVSVAVNGFNGGRAAVRFFDSYKYVHSGTRFDIEDSDCTVILETVDEAELRAGFRMSCS